MIATIVAILCGALAFTFVLADAALLASEQDDDGAGVHAHAATHRALAFARVVAILACGVATAMALDLPARSSIAAVAIALVAAFGVVVVAETAAREVGHAIGARGVGRLAPMTRAAELLFAPLLWLSARLDARLLRALPPAAADASSREESAEQFREVITSEADVSREEQSLLAGVFSLGETTVSEIMVPRVDVIGIAHDAPWSEVVDRVRSSEHSRVPVYDGTLDDIVGILYAKDLLPAVIAGEEPVDGWDGLVRPPLFIPGTKQIDDQLRDFRVSGTHIAIVVDEYGGTEGLVTIDDVLEEIVGDIRDENDEDVERTLEREGEDRFWVSGRMTLGDLSEITGSSFEHEEVSTVGGLVYELVGRVPRAGERLTIGDFRVVVERVVRRRVQRVYLERVTGAHDGADDQPAARTRATERVE